MEKIVSAWQRWGFPMVEFWKKFLGGCLALGLLKLACVPTVGGFIFRLPLLIIFPIRTLWPAVGFGFFLIYSIGMVIGKWKWGLYADSFIWPEFLALLVLFLLSDYLGERFRNFKLKMEERHESIKREADIFFEKTEKLKNENLRMEKQLRDIEYLYDVMKEASSTLNVQEMIELSKEFVERIFDFPHFVMAVLSEDGKKYEIRTCSGCDESFFRSFQMEVSSGQLMAELAHEKKPYWVPAVENDEYFSKLKNLPLHSFVFFPFLVQDRAIGFLCSFSMGELLLDGNQFSNLQIFCNQISIGLQKSLLYEKVQNLSITDGLTRLYSHRHFKQRLEEELVLARRYSSVLSLLILDIDHFKHYNDTYGHVAGDNVLKEVARIVKSQTAPAHIAARYGGEEMALIASETSKKQALELAEKIRREVESYSFSVGNQTTTVTISIGVAAFPEDAQNHLDLIGKSDNALYAAKNRGRNRVIAFPP